LSFSSTSGLSFSSTSALGFSSISGLSFSTTSGLAASFSGLCISSGFCLTWGQRYKYFYGGNLLMFVYGRPLKPSLMVEGKARSGTKRAYLWRSALQNCHYAEGHIIFIVMLSVVTPKELKLVWSTRKVLYLYTTFSIGNLRIF
jgi:hypothetical protein